MGAGEDGAGEGEGGEEGEGEGKRSMFLKGNYNVILKLLRILPKGGQKAKERVDKAVVPSPSPLSPCFSDDFLVLLFLFDSFLSPSLFHRRWCARRCKRVAQCTTYWRLLSRPSKRPTVPAAKTASSKP